MMLAQTLETMHCGMTSVFPSLVIWLPVLAPFSADKLQERPQCITPQTSAAFHTCFVARCNRLFFESRKSFYRWQPPVSCISCTLQRLQPRQTFALAKSSTNSKGYFLHFHQSMRHIQKTCREYINREICKTAKIYRSTSYSFFVHPKSNCCNFRWSMSSTVGVISSRLSVEANCRKLYTLSTCLVVQSYQLIFFYNCFKTDDSMQ